MVAPHEEYKCNILEHDELQKIPQYMNSAFQNLQKALTLLDMTRTNRESKEESQQDEGFGYIDPVIRLHKGIKNQVVQQSQQIQFSGPKIVKKTEEVIKQIKNTKAKVRDDIDAMKKKHSSKVAELKKQLKYSQKENERLNGHLNESIKADRIKVLTAERLKDEYAKKNIDVLSKLKSKDKVIENFDDDYIKILQTIQH